MSKYTIYYNTRQDMYRTLAAQWISWAKDFNLTEDQARGMKLFFRQIGKRFGLITEFRKIGVI